MIRIKTDTHWNTITQTQKGYKPFITEERRSKSVYSHTMTLYLRPSSYESLPVCVWMCCIARHKRQMTSKDVLSFEKGGFIKVFLYINTNKRHFWMCRHISELSMQPHMDFFCICSHEKVLGEANLAFGLQIAILPVPLNNRTPPLFKKKKSCPNISLMHLLKPEDSLLIFFHMKLRSHCPWQHVFKQSRPIKILYKCA